MVSHAIPHRQQNDQALDNTQPPGTRNAQRGGTGNFANDPERARAAGQKGGQKSGGNFAKDPERAREAGRKGGQASRGGHQDSSTQH